MARTNIMLCYPFEEKRFNKWEQAIIQPKLDGFRCRALIRPDGVDLLSSEENSFNFAAPHISESLYKQAKLLMDNGIFELDGELYNHDLSFEEISSICNRTVNCSPNHQQIEFHIFDHVCEETQFQSRLLPLYNTIKYINDPNLVNVPNMHVTSMEQIESALKTVTSNGYEGIIARNPNYPYQRKRSTGIMKWKPKKQDEYEIVDLLEEHDKHGNPKGTLGAFVVTDGTNQFKVGTGFTEDQRKAYWEMKGMAMGRSCIIQYQHITSKGVPRFPVFKVMVG